MGTLDMFVFLLHELPCIDTLPLPVALGVKLKKLKKVVDSGSYVNVIAHHYIVKS